ncbi:unnamed protein product [marine sediment metagenome]|uniref:Uncharacterized protein n=1 Tax=marine sediment metagenome TaxID=412755 RepID=X1K236_9ZZZZ
MIFNTHIKPLANLDCPILYNAILEDAVIPNEQKIIEVTNKN